MSHGEKTVNPSTGEKISWADEQRGGSFSGRPAAIGHSIHPTQLPASVGGSGCDESVVLDEIGVFPPPSECEWNAILLDNVHPREWVDPTPPEGFVYDLIAIGAGAGGLVSSRQASRRGARTALIECHLAGGDCLNVGCVPSKALIRAARCAKECRSMSSEMGIQFSGGITVDFPAIMTRLRRIRARIAPADCLEGSTAKGVDTYQGRATILSPDTVGVNGQVLRFKNLVVATGGSPALPAIPGLKEAPYETNASIFNLTVQPKKMVVIGGGPIGLELAQAFVLFGTEVTVALRGDKVLPKEDPDAAKIVQKALVKDGIKFIFGCTFDSVSGGKGAMSVNVTVDGKAMPLECDTLLVATGRKPNVRGIGLEAGNIAYSPQDGVLVDNFLRSTSNPKVWAVGDVCTKFQFTHVAGAMAGIVIENAIFGGSRKFDHTLIPWATFTEPEVAHTGLYEADCVAKGIEIDTFKCELAHCDRAICESADEGFVKVHCRKGTDEILGATIVAAAAGEMISELTVAMQTHIGLGELGRVVHPYPTVANAIEGCAFGYNSANWQTVSKATIAAAPPPPKGKGQYCVSVNLFVKSARRDEFLDCIRANEKGTTGSEPLALEYSWGESVTEPNTFHFQEKYKGKAGFEAHQKTQHFADWEAFAGTDPFTKAPEVFQFEC